MGKFDNKKYSINICMYVVHRPKISIIHFIANFIAPYLFVDFQTVELNRMPSPRSQNDQNGIPIVKFYLICRYVDL
jgi:hypothetical protein